nr:TetR/AcrR family transcriptional regulator [Acidisoma cellulosilyticum]
MARNAKPEKRVLTARGLATRQRIVAAAADLIYAASAERVSLDEIMEASGTSKSQLYHYFSDKDALVRAVIDIQTDRILQANSKFLGPLDSFEGLRAWRDALIQANRLGVSGGCPIGSLASELSSQSEDARRTLDQSFLSWTAVIESGLSRMKARGHLRPSADTKTIALAVLAAIQGGILLSKTASNSQPLEVAFDMALAHIAQHAA